MARPATPDRRPWTPCFLAAALLLASCADAPVAPLDGGEGRGGEADADAPAFAVQLTCGVDVRANTMECEPSAPSSTGEGPSMNLIVGSQHRYVRLANSAPDQTASLWYAGVTVQNLTLQPFATSDGTTPDPRGVRVFFVDEPTNGVEIWNHDGEAAFLGSDPTEKYYEYAGPTLGADGILSPGGTSYSKRWDFVHNGATTFEFSVLIWTTVPDPAGYSASLTQLSAGTAHSCGVDAEGRAYCWGQGWQGQLGDGTDSVRSVPVPIHAPPGASFSAISAGAFSSCADAEDGSVYCWGQNDEGQLGDGTTTDRFAPVRVKAPAGVNLSGVAINTEHACALDDDGAAYCWGRGASGRLGTGSTANRHTPAPVTMPHGVRFTRLAVGRGHGCADGNDGRVYCWGSGFNGQLGTGNNLDQTSPVAVAAPVGVRLSHVTAGDRHSCAQGDDGNVYCWGGTNRNQLGVDTTATAVNRPVPVAAPAGVTFSKPAAGEYHTCAIGSDGRAYCWGWNESGQLGDGTTTDQPTPVAVDAPPGVIFESLDAGSRHTCAMSTAGDAYCWGSSIRGMLGDGTTSGANKPWPVLVAGTRGR